MTARDLQLPPSSSSSLLSFDPVAHRYTVDGEVLPGVTTILRPLSDAFYAGISREVLRAKAELGEAVHKAAELYDARILDESTVHPLVRPYLDAYVDFRQKLRFVPIASELRVWSPASRFAGTLDLLGTIDQAPALVDIKCTVALMPSVGPQTAAYQRATSESPNVPEEIRALAREARRFCLRLGDDGRYRLDACDDPHDLRTFLSLLNLHYFKLKHAKHFGI